ncbi:MAG: hypothetical protein JSS82_01565 [Bacteroidetes bacterium]|nr:hypothetical protein [Bacteroidota bacterium]
MKKIYLVLSTILLAGSVSAQPWMPLKQGPQKLDDIVARHKQQMALTSDEDGEHEYDRSGKEVREAKDHLFQKWEWYWRQHLDKDGYMVPTIRTWQEWQKWQNEHAQHAAAKSTANQSQWAFVGPDTSNGGGYYGIGRINVVAFHPTDPNTYWIGSAGGGAWKTTNDGHSWTPMYHDLPVLGVADIDYNPQNPNTIYLCTGDRDGGDTYSIGVMKSVDGGATWNATGLAPDISWYFQSNTLIINPTDTNNLLLAANWGIYRTTNGGQSWTNVQNGDFKEVVYCPGHPNIVYAAGSQIWRSADSGLTWTQITNVSNVNRVSVAVSADNPAIVKAIFSTADNSGLAGIYSSSDTGNTFTEIYSVPDCSKNLLSWSTVPDANSCGGQGWYDLCIAMDPANVNNVIIGGVNTWYSTDGGYNWTIATEWYTDNNFPLLQTVHADKHYLKYHPLVPGKLFECCDGGIYSCTDPLSLLWSDKTNGLGITEFYRNAVTGVNPFVIGGAQDNGTKAVRVGQSLEMTGGDGMDCQEDYVTPFIVYTSSQNGYLMRSNDGGQNYVSISDNVPGNPGGSWVTPFFIDPHVHTSLYAGFDKLYYSTDTGNTWTAISNVFDTSHTIDRIALSNTNINNIYVLVNNNLYRTTNFGGSWNQVTVPYPGWISDIAIDPHDAGQLWVTFSSYDTAKVASYRPSQGGWSNYSQGLPNVPASCIVVDTFSKTKYIGTDVGVFYRDTTMTQWALYNNNLAMPSVHVSDLGINYVTNEIWAATYGRGMWHSPKNEHPLGISIVPLVLNAMAISPNPNTGSFTVSGAASSFGNKKVQARLVDESGRTAWQAPAAFNANGSMDVHTSNLAKGKYIFEVSGKDVLARASVIIY